MNPIPTLAPAAGEEDRLRTVIAGLKEQVNERTRQLAAARAELEIFSHSMSHDLRAPLRSIVGFTRSLLEDQGARFDDDGRRTLHVIRDEARRMSQLIEDLGSYARVGRQSLDVAATDMSELARSAFQDLVEPATTVTASLQVGPMPAAHADRVMVRQVFRHLLGNAIKFSRGRPGAAINVTGLAEGGWNTYCVADNGVGFDQRYAHKLFGVFQRLHRLDDFEGSGVGLAVVRRIVERHGGRTWAGGEVNSGARFYFTLPGTPEIQS